MASPARPLRGPALAPVSYGMAALYALLTSSWGPHSIPTPHSLSRARSKLQRQEVATREMMEASGPGAKKKKRSKSKEEAGAAAAGSSGGGKSDAGPPRKKKDVIG